ncbi:hypothetical protein ACQKLP_07985 [Chitinophaga sp. NPDC101104]|uniref:hypothetical protein n=1 Tax=Chitinophaga sp. NPDC101104 TaxID=3390561 RepID=UPI003D066340
MKLFPSLLLCCAIFLAGCSKNNNSEGGPEPSEPPAVRAHGTPAGDIVKKTIGAAGGTLTSKDNSLRIDIPAGALAANTEISVQAVTNTLPGSPGPSYRLLPENVQFTKPVKLTFQYTDRHLDSTSAEALFLAFQSADGIWRFIPKTELNATAKTLTVETTHFSDWAPFAMYWLRADPNSVRVGKLAAVLIYTAIDKYKANENSQPIAIRREYALENSSNIRNWKLIGGGTLKPEGRLAWYQAPAKVPKPATVQVSVDIYNFIPPGFFPGRGATGKLILLTKIKVVDDVYFSGTLNGAEVFCTGVHHKYITGTGWINIAGLLPNNLGFSVNIENVTQPITAKQYNWFVPDHGGTVFFVYGSQTTPAVVKGRTFYNKCDANGTVEDYVGSPGLLVIHRVENVGGVEYIEGSLRGELYPQIDCGPGARMVFELDFRTKNIQ